MSVSIVREVQKKINSGADTIHNSKVTNLNPFYCALYAGISPSVPFHLFPHLRLLNHPTSYGRIDLD